MAPVQDGSYWIGYMVGFSIPLLIILGVLLLGAWGIVNSVRAAVILRAADVEVVRRHAGG